MSKINTEKQDIYVVFEGGGAKGIAHLGALEAIEDSELHSVLPPLVINGVAGTSIGAVVAALVAAGARSKRDLMDSDGSVPLLTPLKEQTEAHESSRIPLLSAGHVTDLFRSGGWRRILQVRFIFRHPVISLVMASTLAPAAFWLVHAAVVMAKTEPGLFSAKIILSLLFLTTLTALHKITFWLFSLKIASTWIPYIFIFLSIAGSFLITSEFTLQVAGVLRALDIERLMCFVIFSLLLFWIFDRIRSFFKGLVSTEDLRVHLNQSMARLIATSRLPDGTLKFDKSLYINLLKNGVKFKDLKIPLRIVAADVTGGSVVVWPDAAASVLDDPTADNPGQRVADAVVASVAIPFIFKPRFTAKANYVDGGIVSNIPAWVFRSQKSLNPDAYILAIALAPEPLTQDIPRFQNERRKYEQKWGRGGKLVYTWLPGNIFRSLSYPFRLFKYTVHTAVFGARTLELDATDRLEVITLNAIKTHRAPNWFQRLCGNNVGVDVPVGLLDFDIKKDERLLVIRDNRFLAEQRLLWIFARRHLAFNNSCRRIEQQMYERAADSLGTSYLSAKHQLETDGGILNYQDQSTSENKIVARPGRVRFFLAQKNERADALKIVRTYNFQSSLKRMDLDDRLFLPAVSTLAGQSDKNSEIYFGERDRLLDFAFNRREDRYRRAVKWEELQWCWTIPFETPQRDGTERGPKVTRFVLGIESNIPIDEFGGVLSMEAKRESDRWNSIHPNLPGDRHGPSATLHAIAHQWAEQLAADLDEGI